jgi:hypothetical protein
LPILVIGVAVFAGLKINELVLIGGGLLPLFRFVTKQYQENTESGERLTKLNNHFDKVWEKVIRGEIDKDELGETARRIQDEIYENRIKSPLILDIFYRLYRAKEEALMAKSADSLVAEFRDAFPNA